MNLLKYYILDIPFELYGIGVVFFLLLLWICCSAAKEIKQRGPKGPHEL